MIRPSQLDAELAHLCLPVYWCGIELALVLGICVWAFASTIPLIAVHQHNPRVVIPLRTVISSLKKVFDA